MTRRTSRDLREAFARYRHAYALAGLGTAERYPADGDRPAGTYRSTAADLCLQEPGPYAGRVYVSPMHNAFGEAPEYPGASGAAEPAGIEYLGDTYAECFRTLEVATRTLLALVDAERPERAPYTGGRMTPAARAKLAERLADLGGLYR